MADEKADEFTRDFARMMTEVRLFCTKYHIDAPTIVFGRNANMAVRRNLRWFTTGEFSYSYVGVPFRFGEFENATVFREF